MLDPSHARLWSTLWLLVTPTTKWTVASGHKKVSIWSWLVTDLLATILVWMTLQALHQKHPCSQNGHQEIANQFNRLPISQETIAEWLSTECQNGHWLINSRDTIAKPPVIMQRLGIWVVISWLWGWWLVSDWLEIGWPLVGEWSMTDLWLICNWISIDHKPSLISSRTLTDQSLTNCQTFTNRSPINCQLIANLTLLAFNRRSQQPSSPPSSLLSLQRGWLLMYFGGVHLAFSYLN